MQHREQNPSKTDMKNVFRINKYFLLADKMFYSHDFPFFLVFYQTSFSGCLELMYQLTA